MIIKPAGITRPEQVNIHTPARVMVPQLRFRGDTPENGQAKGIDKTGSQNDLRATVDHIFNRFTQATEVVATLLQGLVKSPKQTKVAVIGAGNVGSSLAKDLVRDELCNTVSLVDINDGVAKGKALDIQEAAPLYNSDTQIIGGNDFKIIEGADVVVVTAGFPRKPGMSRDDLLESTAKVVAGVAEKIKKHAPDSTVIVVSNPLDAMALLTQKVTGFPSNRVIGMAGVLDAARFKTFVAQELKVGVEDIQAMVLGGHGDTMVPLPRYTTVGGIPITELMDKATLDKIIDRTRNGGAEVVGHLNTSAYIAPGASIAKMVASVLKGKNQVLPCSALLNGQYGVNGLYIGVPVKLGKNGIEEIIELNLLPEEQALFQQSTGHVQANAQKLDGILERYYAEKRGGTDEKKNG
jgi:malate dehydrogenase